MALIISNLSKQNPSSLEPSLCDTANVQQLHWFTVCAIIPINSSILSFSKQKRSRARHLFLYCFSLSFVYTCISIEVECHAVVKAPLSLFNVCNRMINFLHVRNDQTSTRIRKQVSTLEIRLNENLQVLIFFVVVVVEKPLALDCIWSTRFRES